MKFTKMHGAGNDYIYVNCFEEKITEPGKLAVKYSDRHFGIGSDGLVLICPSQVADFKMEMFNSDGSQAEMCGNAIRCVGKYVYDKKLTDKKAVTVETLAGIKTLEFTVVDGAVSTVKVNMGAPIFIPEQIPAVCTKPEFTNETMTVDGKEYKVTCVSMGNPHAVIFMDDVQDLHNLNLEHIGPMFETHELFPRKINTEFAVLTDEGLHMRVWERGAGETLACGTGACATLVAAVKAGKTAKREMRLILKGGELLINWDENDNNVYMTGSAEFVFDGETL